MFNLLLEDRDPESRMFALPFIRVKDKERQMKPLIGWSSIELIPLFVASSASLEMKLMELGPNVPKDSITTGKKRAP